MNRVAGLLLSLMIVAPAWAGSEELQELCEQLREGSESKRTSAAYALCALGPEAGDALDALAWTLVNDPSEDVRFAAREALEALESPAARRVHLTHPEFEWEETGALVGVARASGGLALVAQLAVSKVEDAPVWAAQEALAALGPRAAEAVPILLARFDRRDYDLHELLEVVGPGDGVAWSKALTRDDSYDQYSLRGVLGEMGPRALPVAPRALELLDLAFEHESNDYLRSVECLLHVMGPAVTPLMLGALSDARPTVRRGAVRMLSDWFDCCGGPAPDPVSAGLILSAALAALEREPDVLVRGRLVELVWVYACYDRPRAEAALHREHASSSSWVRRRARHCLAELRPASPRSARAMRVGLRDPWPDNRAEAANRYWSYVDDLDVLPVLADLARDESEFVRRHATPSVERMAYGLEQSGDGWQLLPRIYGRGALAFALVLMFFLAQVRQVLRPSPGPAAARRALVLLVAGGAAGAAGSAVYWALCPEWLQPFLPELPLTWVPLDLCAALTAAFCAGLAGVWACQRSGGTAD